MSYMILIEVTLSPDGTALLTPIIQPEDVTDIKLIWSSSDESIVTVDENGNIKAIKEGTAIITVMTSDGIHTASCKVIVSKEVIKAESIKISGLNVVTVGGTINLTAKVSPDNATNKSVNWTSSNNRVATVDSSGYVRGISAGKVTITATTVDGGHKATYEITVNAETTKTNTSASNNSANNSSSSKSQKPATVHVTSVNISGTNRVLVGQSINLSANVSPGNATNKGISWSSNNPSVARVEQNGRVTGVNDGTATITVTTSDGNHQASITVTVSSTYSITFTADRTSADGEITGYYAHVYKNGSLFTGYDYLLYNGMEKPFKQRILKSEVNTGVRSAKVNVNGTYYDATVSYN